MAGKIPIFERGLPGIKHGGPSSGRGVAGEWPGANRENPGESGGGRGVAGEIRECWSQIRAKQEIQIFGAKKIATRAYGGETIPTSAREAQKWSKMVQNVVGVPEKY